MENTVSDLSLDYERNMIMSCLEMYGNLLPSDIRLIFSDSEDKKYPSGSTVISVGVSLRNEYAHLTRPLSAAAVAKLLCGLSLSGVSHDSEAITSPAAPVSSVLSFDGRNVSISSGGRNIEISFTSREAQVFGILYASAGSIVPREDIESAVWNGKSKSNLCDVYISRLRDKLEPFGRHINITYIHTKGYRMDILLSD